MTADLSSFTEGIGGTFLGLARAANTVTNGILFNFGMFVFFFIILMALLKFERPFEEAVTVSAWSMFMVSALFWLAKLVVDMVPITFFVISILGTIYLYASK